MSDDSMSEGSENGDNIGVYEGERNCSGERHGSGRATLPGGDVYEGSYECGLRHGSGEYRKARGPGRYTGDWQHGSRHGTGTCVYDDGSVYQGEWLNDKRHGQGVMKYANGDQYIGEWVNGERDDPVNGLYHFLNGSFVGTWSKGQRHGSGMAKWTDGFAFIGRWKNDEQVEGDGTFVLPNCVVAGETLGRDGEWRTLTAWPRLPGDSLQSAINQGRAGDQPPVIVSENFQHFFQESQ